jgi:hypothetical protein
MKKMIGIAAVGIAVMLSAVSADAGTITLVAGPLLGGGTREAVCQVANNHPTVSVTATGTIWAGGIALHSQTVPIGPHGQATVASAPPGDPTSHCEAVISSPSLSAAALRNNLRGTFQMRVGNAIETVVPLQSK